MENILDVLHDPIFDNRITKYQYHSYQPFASATLDNLDEIRIPINQMDSYLHPSESYLYIEGHVTFSQTTDITSISLTNNFPAFLFEEIRIEMNSVEVDQTKNVGITTLLKNLCSLDVSELNCMSVSGWDLKDNFMFSKNEKFDIILPLKKILGFCEDYKKLILNAKLELVLLRSRNDLNCWTYTSDQSTKIKLHKIQWWIPHVNLDDWHKLQLLEILKKSVPITISFRTWDLYELPLIPTTTKHSWMIKTSTQLEKPRFIILAFQTGRKNNFLTNGSVFDNSNISDVKVYLNSEIYPYENLNIDFRIKDKKSTSLLYYNYSRFKLSYYNDELHVPLLNYTDFIANYPIHVIDCSKQNESIKNGVVDIRIEFQANEIVKDSTSAYCLILHDKLMQYNPFNNIVEKIV